MGARGPAPKPTKLKILNGSAEHHPERINRNEPKPAPHAPVMPADMAPRAREVWERVMREQAPGVILAVHEPILRIFCDAVARYEQAIELLGTGLVIRGSRGRELTRNPLLGIARGEADLIRLYARELGLTPSSVVGLSGVGAAEADPMADLLRPRRPVRGA